MATKSRKSKKAKYMARADPRTNPVTEIGVGSSGVLAMVSIGKEKYAIRELAALLSEYSDKIMGEEEKSTCQEDTCREPSDEPISIEDSLSNELKSIKTNKNRRFWGTELGIDCCVFVKASEGVPLMEIFNAMLKDLAETGKKKSRHVMRLVPIQKVCKAHKDNILSLTKKLIETTFGSPLDPEASTRPVLSYSIVPRTRNNDSISKSELITKIAEQVGPYHKVDLTKPRYCILVEVFKNLCGVSIVDNYYEFKKYNLEVIEESFKNRSSL